MLQSKDKYFAKAASLFRNAIEAITIFGNNFEFAKIANISVVRKTNLFKKCFEEVRIIK